MICWALVRLARSWVNRILGIRSPSKEGFLGAYGDAVGDIVLGLESGLDSTSEDLRRRIREHLTSEAQRVFKDACSYGCGFSVDACHNGLSKVSGQVVAQYREALPDGSPLPVAVAAYDDQTGNIIVTLMAPMVGGTQPVWLVYAAWVECALEGGDQTFEQYFKAWEENDSSWELMFRVGR